MSDGYRSSIMMERPNPSIDPERLVRQDKYSGACPWCIHAYMCTLMASR